MTEESDDLKSFTVAAKQLAVDFRANPQYTGPDLLKTYIDENRRKVKMAYIEVLTRIEKLNNPPLDNEVENLAKSVTALFSEMAAIGDREDWTKFLYSSKEFARTNLDDRADGRFKIEDVTQKELEAYRNSLLEHPHIQGIKQLSEQGSKLLALENIQKVLADRPDSIPAKNINEKKTALLHQHKKKKRKSYKYFALTIAAILTVVTAPLAFYFMPKSNKNYDEAEDISKKLREIDDKVNAVDAAFGDESKGVLELSDSKIKEMETTLMTSIRETAAEIKEQLKEDDPAPKDTRKKQL